MEKTMGNQPANLSDDSAALESLLREIDAARLPFFKGLVNFKVLPAAEDKYTLRSTQRADKHEEIVICARKLTSLVRSAQLRHGALELKPILEQIGELVDADVIRRASTSRLRDLADTITSNLAWEQLAAFVRDSEKKRFVPFVLSSKGLQCSSPQRPLNAFDKFLQAHNLKEKAVSSDGNCQFRAIADQLWGDEQRYGDVRKRVVQQLRADSLRYKSFVCDEDFHSYVARMETDREWGDGVTLQAIADAMSVTINVASDRNSHDFVEVRPQGQSVRTLMVVHWAEIHYNSLETADPCSTEKDHSQLVLDTSVEANSVNLATVAGLRELDAAREPFFEALANFKALIVAEARLAQRKDQQDEVVRCAKELTRLVTIAERRHCALELKPILEQIRELVDVDIIRLATTTRLCDLADTITSNLAWEQLAAFVRDLEKSQEASRVDHSHASDADSRSATGVCGVRHSSKTAEGEDASGKHLSIALNNSVMAAEEESLNSTLNQSLQGTGQEHLAARIDGNNVIGAKRSRLMEATLLDARFRQEEHIECLAQAVEVVAVHAQSDKDDISLQRVHDQTEVGTGKPLQDLERRLASLEQAWSERFAQEREMRERLERRIAGLEAEIDASKAREKQLQRRLDEQIGPYTEPQFFALVSENNAPGR